MITNRLVRGRKFPLNPLEEPEQMARPLKSDEQKRNIILRVRVTSCEKKKIAELAKASGCTTSDWIRLKAISSIPLQRVLKPGREVLIKHLANAGKIGSNLNQIAREINRRAKTGEHINFGSDILNQALIAVENLAKQLLEILKNDNQRKA